MEKIFHIALLLGFMLMPAMAMADPPQITGPMVGHVSGQIAGHSTISKGLANSYYKNCNANDDPRMSDNAQDSLCGCTAAKIMDVMSAEEIAGMTTNIGPGRIAYNKMLTTVYGPCMQAPVEEILYQECMNDKNIKEFMLRNTPMLCRCTAYGSGRTLIRESTEIMPRLLKGYPNMTDPLDYILADRVFRQKAYANLYECLRTTP